LIGVGERVAFREGDSGNEPVGVVGEGGGGAPLGDAQGVALVIVAVSVEVTVGIGDGGGGCAGEGDRGVAPLEGGQLILVVVVQGESLNAPGVGQGCQVVGQLRVRIPGVGVRCPMADHLLPNSLKNIEAKDDISINGRKILETTLHFLLSKNDKS